VTRKHKNARKSFALKHLTEETDFNEVIFTDEKKFRWDGPDGWRHYWAGMDDASAPVEYSKDYGQFHGVMVWAAMSSKGILHIERIQGRLDGPKYADLICGDALAAFHEKHGTEFTLQQDNAPPHRARGTLDTFKERGVPYMEWPGLSPDINPIENLWSLIVRRVYDGGKFYNSDDELWDGIQRAASEISLETIRGLVQGMRARLLRVLELDGGYVQQ
jgi:hypothetical protein